MLVLGLETATAHTGVAVGGPDGVLASLHLRHEHRHSETLAPAIELVCRQAGIRLRSITCIAVDIGPGLFSGLRVGVSTANAIAHALQIPIMGVSSLDLVAFPARLTVRKIVAMLDALRGEVYWATYTGRRDDVEQLSKPVLAAPEETVQRVRGLGEPCVIVGDGTRHCSGALQAVPDAEIAGPDFDFPSAVSLVHMTAARSRNGQPGARAVKEILYLREPHITRQRRDRERS